MPRPANGCEPKSSVYARAAMTTCCASGTIPFTTRSKETYVFWDSDEGGPLRVMVDICEPKRGVVPSIASDDFIRAPDGSFIGE